MKPLDLVTHFNNLQKIFDRSKQIKEQIKALRIEDSNCRSEYDQYVNGNALKGLSDYMHMHNKNKDRVLLKIGEASFNQINSFNPDLKNIIDEA